LNQFQFPTMRKEVQQMTSITVQTTIGELVAEQPALMRFFERLGIDYCCGGKHTLAEASAEKGLDVNTVLQMIQALADLPQAGQPEEINWAKAGLADLCDHIEHTHHLYLKEELPRLGSIVETVAKAHGDRHLELHQVRSVFHALAVELGSHLLKEERILFPAIRQLEKATDASHVMPISAPISVMIAEHDSTGEALATLRRLTDDYAIPPDGCNTYRALLAGLAQLEADTHRHISLENNILFPRALSLQKQ
jgi:regulator of cell morphogenesis and NO signaling